VKLQGVKVVDLSTFLPGPYMTLAMADHGAEVIKIEQPGEGDPGRHIGLSDGEHTVFFRNINRGKRSLAVDLKSDAGRERVLALVDAADVFVESFRPGVMKRLGLDASTLRARNPRLVYCSISAFGQDSARPAHDLAVEAMSGTLSMGLGNDGQPAMPGIPWSDVLSGLHALSGVLMALYRRETTGQGDTIDVSMLDSMVGASLNILGPTFVHDRQPNPLHERTTGGSAFYRVYRTLDGKHVALAGQEPKFVTVLLSALDRPDLSPLVLQGPGEHQAPVMAFLEAEFSKRTRDDWDRWLAELDVCYGPVRTLPEVIADPGLVARGTVLRDAQGRPHIGSPIRFADEPARLNLHPPSLGEYAAS